MSFWAQAFCFQPKRKCLSEILAFFKEKGETNRKSSSMSSTLASKLFEVFSFNSNSRIRFVIIMVFRVIGFPGRCIRNIQGSHWRNSVRTCRHKYIQFRAWVGNLKQRVPITTLRCQINELAKLKVSKSRKQFMEFSILPKNERSTLSWAYLLKRRCSG